MNVKTFEQMNEQEKRAHVDDLSTIGLIMTPSEKRYLHQLKK